SGNAEYAGSSTDGSAVAFQIQGDPSLYVRLNNTTTLQVTASASTFEGLAGDGSAVFYLQGGDLYRYDTNSQQTTQITNTGDFPQCLSTPFPGAHPSCVVNIPEDGHQAYFSSQSVLAAGGQAGQDNLYYWDGSSIGFIGVVDPQDVTIADDSGGHPIPSLSHWDEAVSTLDPQPVLDTSRATPDGTTIAFKSRAKLTSYDNQGQIEIYRYKIGDPGPTCVSCDPNGQPPGTGAQFLSLGTVGSPRDFNAEVHNLSTDGRTVTFESSDAL